jgi:hypothetical protein
MPVYLMDTDVLRILPAGVLQTVAYSASQSLAWHPPRLYTDCWPTYCQRTGQSEPARSRLIAHGVPFVGQFPRSVAVIPSEEP